MPFNPDGTWKPEDDLVAPRLSGLLAQDNPLMKQAATAGKQYANKRGLLNSTLGAQASQQESIKAALPIAQQEASQIAQKNLSGMSIGSQEKMQGIDVAAQKERLEMQLGSAAALQAAEAAAAKERLGMTLTAEEQRQVADLDAAMSRLTTQIAGSREQLEMELGSRQALQLAEAAAEKERLGMQLTSQESLALADLNAAEERLGMQLGSQEQIAGMNVASNDREKAAALAATTNAAYLNAWQAIANNTDIPAAARDQYMTHLKAVFDGQMDLIQQLYDIDLTWPGQPAAA